MSQKGRKKPHGRANLSFLGIVDLNVAGRVGRLRGHEKTENPNAGYRYPAEIISHIVWLYFRLTLSYRDHAARESGLISMPRGI